MAKKAKAKRGFVKYKSYLFVEKDPVIDAMRTVHQLSERSLQRQKAETGVSVAAMRGWFYGKVRRPQFCTVSAFALGNGKRTITFHAGKPRFE